MWPSKKVSRVAKSLKGLRSEYNPQFFGKEGILMTIAVIMAPFVILVVFEKILPMFRQVEEKFASGELVQSE